MYPVDRFFQSLYVHGTSREGPSDVRESSGMVSADVCSAITEEIISPLSSPFGRPVHCASRVADRLTSSALKTALKTRAVTNLRQVANSHPPSPCLLFQFTDVLCCAVLFCAVCVCVCVCVCCLLYTSPSPRDDNRSRMPSSA